LSHYRVLRVHAGHEYEAGGGGEGGVRFGTREWGLG